MVFEKLSLIVTDYDNFKNIFSDLSSLRKSSGSLGAKVFTDSNDTNLISVVFEWDTEKKLLKFSENPDLKVAMNNLGLKGPPTVYVSNNKDNIDIDGLQFKFELEA